MLGHEHTCLCKKGDSTGENPSPVNVVRSIERSEKNRMIFNTETKHLHYIAFIFFCVSAGVMYWGDAHEDKIETARIDGTGRRVVKMEDTAHYFAFLLHDDGDIYFTDWAYKYVSLLYAALCMSKALGFAVVLFLTVDTQILMHWAAQQRYAKGIDYRRFGLVLG